MYVPQPWRLEVFASYITPFISFGFILIAGRDFLLPLFSFLFTSLSLYLSVCVCVCVCLSLCLR